MTVKSCPHDFTAAENYPNSRKSSRFPSGRGSVLVLVAGALALFGLISWVYHPILGLSQVGALAILSSLSGFICAFANANDQRILKKRRIILGNGQDELIDKETSGFLKPKEFILLGSLLGCLFTWISLLVIYSAFASSIGKPITEIAIDLASAASLSFQSLPAPIILGVLAAVSTIAYLFTVRESLLQLAFPIIAITVATILIGIFWFHDPIVGPEFAIPIVLLALFTFYASKKNDTTHKVYHDKTRKRKPRVDVLGLSFLIFTLTEIMRSVILRNTLSVVPGSDRFFVALCLRALYFTVFVFCAICWFISSSYKKGNNLRPRTITRLTRRQFLVLSITSGTFVGAYALSTPTFAYNLSLSPLLFTVVQILAYPFLSSWYFISGSKRNWSGRLRETFSKTARGSGINKTLVISYGLSTAMCAAWAIYQVVA